MELRRYEKGGLLLLAGIFFLVYSWFYFITPILYNSPDETANYFFISQFRDQGDFFVPEQINEFFENRLHPRSILYNGTSLVPQSFVGFPFIFGMFSKIFGLGSIIFLTPFLAILGALAFFEIIRKIFNKRIAFFSFLALLMFPAFWYYASRGFYPNIPFISLFLISFWAYFCGALKEKGEHVYFFIFVISLGASIMIRPIEVFWIGPLYCLSFIFYKKLFSFKRLIFAFLALSFLALPIFYFNNFLYGDIFESGYTLSGDVGVEKNTDKADLQILPYGFHPRNIINNFFDIIVEKYWWYTSLVFLGFLFWIFGEKKNDQKKYLILSVVISFLLLMFYGSGFFKDNPNIRLTIGDSHFRYWLPIFIVFIPFIGIFLSKIKSALINFVIIIFLCIFSFFSVYTTLDDGLFSIEKNVKSNYQIKERVVSITKPKDIIITGRQDKIFFPHKKVLYSENILHDNILEQLNKLRGINIDFYYYGIGLSSDEVVKINEILKKDNFKIKRIEIFEKEALYKIVSL